MSLYFFLFIIFLNGQQVTAALYADMTDDKTKALKYLEKAIYLQKNHTMAYIVKGLVYLSMNQAEDAIKAYRRANKLDPRVLATYQGLVKSYLSARNPQPQFKQALVTAKEALILMPQNPKALTLVGTVLANSNEGKIKVISCIIHLVYDCICINVVCDFLEGGQGLQ